MSNWRRLAELVGADPNSIPVLTPQEERASQEARIVARALRSLPDGLWEKVVGYLGKPPKKRGRPRNKAKRETWMMAAYLRNDDPRVWTWNKLTQHFDREGYKLDPQRARDRMRQGILSLQREASTQR